MGLATGFMKTHVSQFKVGDAALLSHTNRPTDELVTNIIMTQPGFFFSFWQYLCVMAEKPLW